MKLAYYEVSRVIFCVKLVAIHLKDLQPMSYNETHLHLYQNVSTGLTTKRNFVQLQ